MEDKNRHEKLDFKQRKENVCHSLFEVEHFLKNIGNLAKGLKLYDILKK